MTPFELRPEARALMLALAGDPADRYVEELLVPGVSKAAQERVVSAEELEKLFLDPYGCCCAMLGYYAFMRRGKDRLELGEIAGGAWRDCYPKERFDSFLDTEAADRVWDAFAERCSERGRKPNENLNYGVVAGLIELVQEAYRATNGGSVAQYVGDAVERTGRLETEFMRIVDIRGVGPKFASIFLRDVVDTLDLEEGVSNVDRLYLQPMDKWVRLAARHILSEEEADSADWVLAGKLAKYARHSGVSGIRFNMGATFVGARGSRDSGQFDSILRNLARV